MPSAVKQVLVFDELRVRLGLERCVCQLQLDQLVEANSQEVVTLVFNSICGQLVYSLMQSIAVQLYFVS